MKKIKSIVKLQCKAGQANPAPPVGPALGQYGVNIVEFCQKFNDATKQLSKDTIVPAEITVFEDRTFTFQLKTPPAAFLIKKAAGVEKGAGTPPKQKVGKITESQVREIAQTKMQDLSARDVDQAMKIIEGTARSMGIEITKGG